MKPASCAICGRPAVLIGRHHLIEALCAVHAAALAGVTR